MVDRRGFVCGGVAAVIATWVAPSWATALAATGARGELGREGFARLVNTWFHARSAAGTVRLRLVEVVDGPRAAGLEQFQLVFRASGAPAAAGLFRVSHDDDRTAGGRLLYLEPVRDDAEGRHYGAIFSLLRGSRQEGE